MSNYEIDIAVNDDRWQQDIGDINERTYRVIKSTLKKILNNIEHIEVSIVLADNDFIQTLNKKYRNKDKPTNILSFPQTEIDDITSPDPFISMGDIIIAYETISAEALAQNKTMIDHYTHMLIHGCLHLAHYDHLTDGQAEEMEELEIEILNTIGIKNPYETV